MPRSAQAGCLQALFSLVPGLVLQFSYYHLKGDILASIITPLNFSPIIPNLGESLFVGVPLDIPKNLSVVPITTRVSHC